MMETILDKHIEVTPGVRGGRARLAGTRITVDDIVIMHLHMAQPLEQIAGTYRLPLAAVYAAMAYYFEHKAQIDRQIEEDDAYVEAMRHNAPSKLNAKLRALRGE
jgi:uncharacterized protein (DUF433 family)